MNKRYGHDNLADGIFPASPAPASAEVSIASTPASLRAPFPLSRLRMVPAAVLLSLSLSACGGGSDTAPPNPESGMPPGTQMSDASQTTGTPASSAQNQASNNNGSNQPSVASPGSAVTNNPQNSGGGNNTSAPASTTNTTSATNTAAGSSTGTTGDASGTAQTGTASQPTTGTQSGNSTPTGGSAQIPATPTPAPGATSTPPAGSAQPTPAPTNTINQQPAPVDTSNPATGAQSGGATQTAPANSGTTTTQTPAPASPAPGGASATTSGSVQSNPTPAGTTGQQTTPTATNTPATGTTQASGSTPTNGTQTPDASTSGAAVQQPPATNAGAQTNATSQAGSATEGGNTGSAGTGTPADATAQGGSTQPPATADGGQNTNQPPAPFPPVSESVCKDILAGNLALPVGMNKLDMPDVPRPDVGAALKDEQHNSCVVRITDQAGKNSPTYWRHATVGRQAFNADSTLVLLSSDDWKWRIHDARTGKIVKDLTSISGKAEPHWHPTNPKLINMLPREGLGMKIYRVDVEQDKTTEETIDMAAALQQIWPGATHAWTHASGSPSADHRYWCMVAEKQEGGQNTPYGLFTWDLVDKRIVGHMQANFGVMPSRISTSPSGEFCMTSGAYPDGARIYKRDFSAPFDAQTAGSYLQVNSDGADNQSEIILNAKGEDVYVGTSYSSGGAVFAHNLKTGERKTLFKAFDNGITTGNQFSGLGHKKPGWILVSSYGDHNGTYNLRGPREGDRQWMHRRVFALNLDNPSQVHSIAYMRNDYQSRWPLPNAIVNQDFTKVLFNSSWDSERPTDIDTYMVEIPPSAIPAN
ncbi:MAG: hypothetical protein Q4D19_00930 [Lautropia sp.]|nr:hypothetical protein [Lautropia sp.]